MRRTRLLVSVRDAGEAADALAGGADFIDVKEPSRGPMGMAPPEVIQGIVAAVAGHVPVTAALGDLHDRHVIQDIPDAVAYVKIGVTTSDGWREKLVARFASCPASWAAPVAYAPQPGVDAPGISQVLRWAIDHNASAVLLDTAVKDGSNLLDSINVASITLWLDEAHRHGLVTALAGSLAGVALEEAIALGPDIIAVRGAACVQGQRAQRIDRVRVRALADLIAAHNAQTASPAG